MKQENIQLLSDLQYILTEMDFLHEVSRRILTIKTLPELLTDIMESSKLLMRAEASSLLLYDYSDNKLHFQVARGEKGRLVKQYSVDIGSSIAGWVAEHRKPQVIADCYEDPRFNQAFDQKTNFKTKLMICVPMTRDDHLIGVLQVINKENGEAFIDRDMKIFETLASQCAVAIENAHLIEVQVASEALALELKTARDIQQRLLPSTLPEYDDIEIAAKLIPARQVGGDYYTVLKSDNDQTLLMTADVTGKGIPAAMIVSTVYSSLHSFLPRESVDLKYVVNGMNKILLDSTTNDKFVTCWLGLYDHRTRRLMSINAGHNSPLIFRKEGDGPISLYTGGMFLGCFEVAYDIESIEMLPDDVLVFYTDGVTEALNHSNEQYEEFRLIDIVSRSKAGSANEILACIERDVEQHVDGAPQSDDFTCCVMKVKG